MPWFGLGVFEVEEGEEIVATVQNALEVGYRSIDTAAGYNNEEGVGRAIAESAVPREDIFVTSKLANPDQGYEAALEAFEVTMKKLGLNYLDLYLIHWPLPAKGKYKETWKAFEKLYKDGRIKAIGVSNFKEAHLEDLMADCEIKPMVNQVEYHPRLTQKELKVYCEKHHIQLEAWSPLMQGRLLKEPALVKIAEKYQKTTAQVILRWDLQNEVITIPKSVKPERIAGNADIFNFELSEEDMIEINNLNENKRIGPDPDEFN
ncbi:aldo/keto reductase [Salipaludibacillus sp. HK11]|uniref:aldo/keto reductase n=1 Tax=Salipaludibacillus sp. HK11 TaxID=3394320 RepID=UPI0039FC53DA